MSCDEGFKKMCNMLYEWAIKHLQMLSLCYIHGIADFFPRDLRTCNACSRRTQIFTLHYGNTREYCPALLMEQEGVSYIDNMIEELTLRCGECKNNGKQICDYADVLSQIKILLLGEVGSVKEMNLCVVWQRYYSYSQIAILNNVEPVGYSHLPSFHSPDVERSIIQSNTWMRMMNGCKHMIPDFLQEIYKVYLDNRLAKDRPEYYLNLNAIKFFISVNSDKSNHIQPGHFQCMIDTVTNPNFINHLVEWGVPEGVANIVCDYTSPVAIELVYMIERTNRLSFVNTMYTKYTSFKKNKESRLSGFINKMYDDTKQEQKSAKNIERALEQSRKHDERHPAQHTQTGPPGGALFEVKTQWSLHELPLLPYFVENLQEWPGVSSNYPMPTFDESITQFDKETNTIYLHFSQFIGYLTHLNSQFQLFVKFNPNFRFWAWSEVHPAIHTRFQGLSVWSQVTDSPYKITDFTHNFANGLSKELSGVWAQITRMCPRHPKNFHSNTISQEGICFLMNLHNEVKFNATGGVWSDHLSKSATGHRWTRTEKGTIVSLSKKKEIAGKLRHVGIPHTAGDSFEVVVMKENETIHLIINH